MAEQVSFLIALAAGIISFLSPCILPIIPSYLSFLGGISYSELDERGFFSSPGFR
jgi:cytochrome c-type biogenesis protein